MILAFCDCSFFGLFASSTKYNPMITSYLVPAYVYLASRKARKRKAADARYQSKQNYADFCVERKRAESNEAHTWTKLFCKYA